MFKRLVLVACISVPLVLTACSGEIGQRPAPQAESTFPASPATTTPPGTEPTAAPKASVQDSGTAYAVTLDPDDFVDGVTNPYFPLNPGDHWVYATTTADGTERNDVIVTAATKRILGIDAVVVHDIVTVDGEVTEDTYDWYAQERDGTVWYLGEATEELENGKVVSTEGSWEAGVDGAQPGVVMQAEPTPGPWYWQEYYRGHAEDQARVLGLNASEKVPFGSFDGLLFTEERSPLEPDVVERKYYKRGIGVVLERRTAGSRDVSVLVRYTAR